MSSNQLLKSKLDQLPIQPTISQPLLPVDQRLHITKDSLCGRSFFKHQLVQFYKSFFEDQHYFLKKGHKQKNRLNMFKKFNDIIDKYFLETNNIIYQKVSHLPNKLYVCGYCKDFFKDRFMYIYHCILEQCPLNHERSTVWFLRKDNFKSVENNKFKEILTQKELKTFMNSTYSRYRYRFIDLLYLNIKLTKIKSCKVSQKKNKLSEYYCGSCQKKMRNQGCLILHCYNKCKSYKNQNNSHIIERKYLQQKSSAFVKDIQNLIITYNMIDSMKNYYITLQNSQQIKNSTQTSAYPIDNVLKHRKNKYWCQNCKITFETAEYYLTHALFQCQNPINERSSHKIFKKQMPYPKQDNQLVEEDNLEKQNGHQLEQNLKKEKGHRKNQPKGDKIILKLKDQTIVQVVQEKNYQIVDKLNNKPSPTFLFKEMFNFEYYAEFQNLFQSIYFCGSCTNYYQNRNDYIAHCFVYGCPLNHKRSNFFFYDMDAEGKRTIEMKQLNNNLYQYRKHFPNEYLHQIASKQQLFKVYYEYYQLIDKNSNKLDLDKVKQSKENSFVCGQCNSTFKTRKRYLTHLISSCFSIRCPRNSHQIKLKPKEMYPQAVFQKFIISLIYAYQLTQVNYSQKLGDSQRIFTIISNQQYISNRPMLLDKRHIKKLSEYFCGLCQSTFKNKYQFVYHQLTVCQSLENQSSSHYIKVDELSHGEKLQKIFDIVIDKKDEFQFMNESFKRQTGKKQQMHQKTQHFDLSPLVQENICDNLIDENGNAVMQLIISEEQKQQRNQRIKKRKRTQRKNFSFDENNICEDVNEEKKVTINAYESQPNNTNSINSLDSREQLYLEDNIDYKPHNSAKNNKNKKYYCAPCCKYFKRDDMFVSHLQNQCKSYENLESSHFLISANDVMNLYKGLIMKVQQFKEKPWLRQNKENIVKLRSYELYQYLCGCGAVLEENQYIRHMKNSHEYVVPWGSSHILVRLRVFGVKVPNWIKFPVKLKLNVQDFGSDLFGCPCDMTLKLQREQFVSHVFKRHGGKTPVFYMRRKVSLDEVQNQLNCYQLKKAQLLADLHAQKECFNEKDKQCLKSSQKLATVVEQNKRKKLYSGQDHPDSTQLYRNPSYQNRNVKEKRNYCGACKVYLPNIKQLVAHLNMCKNYKFYSSSHVIMTVSEYVAACRKVSRAPLSLKTITTINRPNKHFSQYQRENFVCGCGTLFWNSKEYSSHLHSNHRGYIPEGSSHLQIRLSNGFQNYNFYFPVQFFEQNRKDIFYCPCNPNRKYDRRQFVKHTFKRHNGISPSCLMGKEELSQF